MSPIEVPRLKMIPATAAISAQVTTGQYLLSRESGFRRSARMDANPITRGRRNGNGVARLTVALVVYLSDRRTIVPFRSGVKTLRQVQGVPKSTVLCKAGIGDGGGLKQLYIISHNFATRKNCTFHH